MSYYTRMTATIVYGTVNSRQIRTWGAVLEQRFNIVDMIPNGFVIQHAYNDREDSRESCKAALVNFWEQHGGVVIIGWEHEHEGGIILTEFLSG